MSWEDILLRKLEVVADRFGHSGMQSCPPRIKKGSGSRG